ncbi:copper-fist-domain-containing protein, partial [Ramicandelaber brevisporus]
MILIDGRKYACPQCVRGHRVGSCQHRDRELIEIRPKGRPATQCKHCRSQRNSRQLHIRCNC